MIDPEDLKVIPHTHPPGGQHVGVLHGVTIVHLPTGMEAVVKHERSQHRNKALALEMLVAALTSPNCTYP